MMIRLCGVYLVRDISEHYNGEPSFDVAYVDGNRVFYGPMVYEKKEYADAEAAALNKIGGAPEGWDEVTLYDSKETPDLGL